MGIKMKEKLNLQKLEHTRQHIFSRLSWAYEARIGLLREQVLDKLAANWANKELALQISRFDLGFGIVGVPEQCKQGKYIPYAEYTYANEFHRLYEVTQANIAELEAQLLKKEIDNLRSSLRNLHKANMITLASLIISSSAIWLIQKFVL